MDPSLLQRFLHQATPLLQGATVERVVCVADGLLLAVRTASGAAELGLLGPGGCAWAYVLREPPTAPPALAEPLSFDVGLRLRKPTGLDTLRAWLLRPATAAPTWMRLQGARLLGLRAPTGDRVLRLLFETESLAASTQLELVAELFDRSVNFILRDADGAELDNWKGRRPAPERAAATAPAAASDAPASLTQAAFEQLAAASAGGLARAHRRALRQNEKKLRSRMAALEEDVQRARQGDVWRRQAEALSAQLHRVRRGQVRVELEDLYAPGEHFVLDLDPRLPPHENAAELFKRARRAARGLAKSETRLQTVRGEQAALQEALAALQALEESPSPGWVAVLRAAASTWKHALTRALVEADREKLWAAGGPAWQAPPAAAGPGRVTSSGPGRSFLLPGGWEVRVGRNNKENDELTHRFAHADDVWLHASGVPGSHVVLRMQGRKDNPPREILEMAAAIAARYSQAKHARTVPVIWTRKRYVRKPRRGAPGLAACTQEKTLFVRPGLPRGQSEEEA